MTNTVLCDLISRDEREDGFTLVEILVVIIIIGILAAIAIPIFLNQQRAARDSATVADVRNLAMNVETLLVGEPDTNYFHLTGHLPESTEATLTVGSKRKQIKVSKTLGTRLAISPVTDTGAATSNANGDGVAGQYVIIGWNADGREYTSSPTAIQYNSAKGKIYPR